MNDGSWVKVSEDKYCNLSQVAFIEETDDATLLYGAGQGGTPDPLPVTDTTLRRQIHGFVEQHGAKQLQTAGAAAARY